MGHKVFVSYKYRDNDVKALPSATQPTWPCDYVEYIQKNVLSERDVYKGEKSNEDISGWGDYRIWEHLKDKISLLNHYLEDTLREQNDINEDTMMQLQLINESIAQMQAENRLHMVFSENSCFTDILRAAGCLFRRLEH